MWETIISNQIKLDRTKSYEGFFFYEERKPEYLGASQCIVENQPT